jgi:hypothetical protein
MAPAELLLQHGCLSRSTAEHGAPLTKGRPACSWGDQSFRFDSQSIQALPCQFPRRLRRHFTAFAVGIV